MHNLWFMLRNGSTKTEGIPTRREQSRCVGLLAARFIDGQRFIAYTLFREFENCQKNRGLFAFYTFFLDEPIFTCAVSLVGRK